MLNSPICLALCTSVISCHVALNAVYENNALGLLAIGLFEFHLEKGQFSEGSVFRRVIN